jgi:glucose-6-phosphate isomerase
MVVLPYKDSLELLSRYLQQLVMESIGKELDLEGKVVNQGIAVYGNKGSTDQHAYVQQLRDGLDNFFVTFIEVLTDEEGRSGPGFDPVRLEVEEGITCGDYLSGFYLGTRQALDQKGRQSVTITVPRVDAFQIGQLLALFERAVGFYATFVGVNAYHQPGVEAGKQAAAEVLALERSVVAYLSRTPGSHSLEHLARQLSREGEKETLFKVLCHLVANGRVRRETADPIFASTYSCPS